jgi:hypothetical protein
MKAITLPSRISVFVFDVLDALMPPENPTPKLHPVGETLRSRHGREGRKEFFYYQQVIDYDTHEIVGHVGDISSGGFKLDCQSPIPVNKDFRFLLNLTSEVADKPFMVFVARSKWCKVDPLDPFIYNVGYQLVQIAPEDLEIFNRMIEKYGRDTTNTRINLRHSNKW